MILFAPRGKPRVDPKALSRVVALCHPCGRQHLIEFDPATGPANAFADWYVKHRHPEIPGAVEFRAPRRNQRADVPTFAEGGWLHYLPNADVKVAYGASAAYACGVASLASSSTFLAGRESTAIDNGTNLYWDYEAAGHVCVGTTPTTAKQIQVWAYGSQNDTPLYPANITGTDGALTLTNAEMRNSGLRQLAAIQIIATTSDLKYPWAIGSIAAAFGMPAPPKKHGIFITHDTVAALNSTAGNHIQSYTGIYGTV